MATPEPSTAPDMLSETWPSVWKGVWAVVGGLAILLFGWVNVHRLNANPRSLNDFVQEWTSARNYFTGRDIYLDMRESVPLYLKIDGELLLRDNAHPPAAVLVSLPLGKLPYARALKIWNWLSMAALGASLLILFSELKRGWSPWYWLPVLTLLLTSNCLAQQQLQGQLNLLLLLLLTCAWVGVRHEHSWWAGGLIGAAAAIKLFPAFLGLYFLMRRDWRGVAGCAIGFAAVNGAAAGVLGVESFRAYFLEVVPRVGGEFQDYWSNASINGFYRKLLDGGSGHVTPLIEASWLAAVLTGVGALAITADSARRVLRADSAERRELALAGCMVAMMLVSPISWDHYFLMLVPALCLIWRAQPAVGWRRPLLLALLLLLFTLRPRWLWDPVIGGDGELALVAGQTASVAAAWQAATVLSYQCFSLLAVYLLAWPKTTQLEQDAAM